MKVWKIYLMAILQPVIISKLDTAFSQGDCSFEQDLCSWRNDNADQFDWTRNSGSTSSTNTGPDAGHTGSGYYLYLEASAPRRFGDRCRLISPQFPPTPYQCFKFWYHMYGSAIGQLNIYLEFSGMSPQTIFSKTGDQDNSWHYEEVVIRSTYPFNVVIEGIRGNSIQGDIAIDDVSFSNETCGECEQLNTTLDGYINYTNWAFYGSIASFGCYEGFIIVGSKALECAYGTWNGTLPSCQPQNCGALNTPIHGNIRYSKGTIYTSIASYSCEQGFFIQGNFDTNCGENRTRNGTEPDCHLLDCGTLDAPTNGSSSNLNGSIDESVAEYGCNRNYTLQGIIERHCLSNGLWNGTEPVCQLLDCGTLDAPTNGNVSFLNGSTYGAVAAYSCNRGYTLNGTIDRHCMDDGTWNGSVAVCKQIDCGTLDTATNGNVSYLKGSTYGAVASYSCYMGYTLQGTVDRHCMDNGTWNGSEPVCKPIDCGMLPPPTHGDVRFSNGTVFESVSSYSCDSGYILQGSVNRTCIANATWDGSEPICQIFDVANGPVCLNCKDLSHLYLCDTIKQCSNNQVCFVEKFLTTAGQIKYNTGCLDKSNCARSQGGIVKRSTECVSCCNTSLCNSNGCGAQGLPPRDQRGPLCYDCAYVSSMDECITITICGKEEVCAIEKHSLGGLFDQYTAKCHSKQCIYQQRSSQLNQGLHRESRSVPVCQQCCGQDLCNDACNMTSQTDSVVPIVG